MTVSSTGSTATPFGFVGKAGYQQDADSGLLLLGHRYYDASTGRFITRDPAKDGRNWFVYADNNTLKFIDTSGCVIVEVRYRQVVWSGWHAYILVTDNAKGSKTYGWQWTISGGPPPDSYKGPGRPITARWGYFGPASYDWPAEGEPRHKSQLIFDDHGLYGGKGFKYFIQQFRRAGIYINSHPVEYHWNGNNSNSAAREMLTRSTFPLTPKPVVWVPGWQRDPWPSVPK